MGSDFSRYFKSFCLTFALAIALFACSRPDAAVVAADTASATWTCQPCVQGSDCASASAASTAWCVQFASDTYCAADCTNGPCANGLACQLLITEAGDSVKACVPQGETCSEVAAVADAVLTTSSCGFDGPESPSCCSGCGNSGSCQANGCYNGWFCATSGCKCVASPPAGACADGGEAQDIQLPDVQPPDVAPGTLTAAGGALPELQFAIVGDTRPALVDDTAGYPSTIATKIWQGVQAAGVPFTITTGDYMFASTYGSEAAPQLDLYLAAAAGYGGLRLPALGNHECTGATASNCGSGGKDGLTKNYVGFLTKMLAPLGLAKPWYTFNVSASDGSWTAKFVFIAANAWGSEQAAWLDAELAKPTTYTFVVRHEPVEADTAPGVTPSEAIIKNHPLTLRIVGHTHTYVYHADSHEVIVGNGGAPLSGSVNYGFVLAKRRADAAIEFDGIEYSSGQVVSTFAINADGSPAP